jgi:TonB family protein
LPQNAERVRPCTLHPVNGRICLSEGVLRGLLMRYVPPKLPESADENGEVLLHVTVSRTGGKPANISAISGDPALMRSAVRAVHEWVFMPYRYEGEEVEMEGDLHIRFKTAR